MKDSFDQLCEQAQRLLNTPPSTDLVLKHEQVPLVKREIRYQFRIRTQEVKTR